MRHVCGLILLAVAAGEGAEQASVRFAVIGDSGTGLRPQYEVAKQMEACREKVNFTFVLMLGDNIYGGHAPEDFKRKFEEPYKPLLDAGVKFYASLGNHDRASERFYKPFNMSERSYFSFKYGNAEFFALDSSYMDPAQLEWLHDSLRKSTAAWKICFMHHPLFTNARFHGSDTDLRTVLVPIFHATGVQVVLAGHNHVYERLKPVEGITYFVLGNSGQLRPHDLRPSAQTAKGFDTGHCFMLMEIAGDQLNFQTISDTGATVDSGTIAQ